MSSALDDDIAARIAAIEPHPRFPEALAAFDAGDAEGLRGVLHDYPELTRARTNLDPPYGYFSAATLLHHVAGNPWRDGVTLPTNVVELARVLLDAGSEVDAMTLGRNGGTTMSLVITGKQASDMNVSGPLIDLLRERGARLELDGVGGIVRDWTTDNILDAPLANHAPRAAEKLIELGAPVDICAAAALGRMDWLRGMFDDRGQLTTPRLRNGKPLSQRDAIGLAMLFAYVNRRREAVDFLLAKDGNWDMIGVNNGTALHRAAWEGDLPMVQRLVALGADVSNRQNPYDSTPLDWAEHNGQREVADWMRANRRIGP